MEEITNRISILGEVTKEPVYSHEVKGERFMKAEIAVERSSGTVDLVPVIYSEKLFHAEEVHFGEILAVDGRVSIYNTHEEDGKHHTNVYVFANNIDIGTCRVIDEYSNYADFTGFICKEPIYRVTPLGKQICDLTIAVNRSYGKSDYIPVIAWGRNAMYASELPVGLQVHIIGRFQSRIYKKTYQNGTQEEKTAYEISASKVDLVESEE